MDIHMVIRGIIVCVCVVDLFWGGGGRGKKSTTREKNNSSKVRVQTKAKKA